MKKNKILRIPDVRRGAPLTLKVNGQPVSAYEGETVMAALFAAGYLAFGKNRTGEPCGPLCGMGLCHECLVTIDGIPNRQACMTPVASGMEVELDIF